MSVNVLPETFVDFALTDPAVAVTLLEKVLPVIVIVRIDPLIEDLYLLSDGRDFAIPVTENFVK